VNDRPKPMAEVAGKPFLDYQLKFLKAYGIRKVVLSTGYLSSVIESHYKKSFEGIDISYAIEKQALGTGGATRHAMLNTVDEDVLVLNGDSFFGIDLKEFYRQHKENAADVSIALRHVDDTSRYGRIETTAGRVMAFNEKIEQSLPGSINGGVYILKKDLFFEHTPAETSFSIEKDFFTALTGTIRIFGFLFDNYFIDIGIPDDYQRAQNDFERFAY
jgi:D-glycero-alpha-D-manno-heptose 1-phosphate guanylyltransferase